jgi:hypothetical protein
LKVLGNNTDVAGEYLALRHGQMAASVSQ